MEAIVIQACQQIKHISKNSSHYKITQRFCMVILRMFGFCIVFIARIFSCTRQCVAKWHKRFLAIGLNGLKDLPRSGRPRLLTSNDNEELEKYVLTASGNEKSLLCQSAINIFKNIFGKRQEDISNATIYRFMKYHGFNKLTPRPIHQKNNEEAMIKWKNELKPSINEIKKANPDKEINIYFQDETRYGSQTIKHKIWAKKGSRPTYIKQNGFMNSWIFGAINPMNGKKFGLILPKLDAQNMQIFLNKFSKSIHYTKHVLLILDGSRAHQNYLLKIPKNITLHFLPPYSPQLNPIERLWLYIKKNYLAFKLYDSIENVIQIGADIWSKVDEKIVKSVCLCDYLRELC